MYAGSLTGSATWNCRGMAAQSMGQWRMPLVTISTCGTSGPPRPTARLRTRMSRVLWVPSGLLTYSIPTRLSCSRPRPSVPMVRGNGIRRAVTSRGISVVIRSRRTPLPRVRPHGVLVLLHVSCESTSCLQCACLRQHTCAPTEISGQVT
ncbi:hypothetical protein OH77DRAFT_1016685 [Trametes cingulata]|nr:hypothetical protein OH77DRAFT_1016685 [Trametes cingulata]